MASGLCYHLSKVGKNYYLLWIFKYLMEDGTSDQTTLNKNQSDDLTTSKETILLNIINLESLLLT